MNIVTETLASAVWPLAFILVSLVVLHNLRETLSPVITALMAGLAKQAQTNAGAWAIAIGFGLSASLAAFYDVFSQLDYVTQKGMSGWQLAALFAKVLNPFVVAMLARLTMQKPVGSTGLTVPPFPTNAANQP